MDELIFELRQFAQQMQLQKYDKLIPVERKGMALMRILLQSSDADIGIDSSKLLSSEAIEYLNPEWFANKKICVFDDTLFTGQGMHKRLKDLQKLGAKVDSSAFAVCGLSTYSPTFKYYDSLSYQDYSAMRLKILQLISESQNLLLDSEHIGLRIHCGLNSSEIMKKLSKLGGPLIITRFGKSGTVAVSIHEPLFFEKFISSFPNHNKMGIFRKIRFLVQDYSVLIVPIVYPPVLTPTSFEECPSFRETNVRGLCLCDDYPDDSTRPLYCSSLYWSAKLLALTLKRLHQIMDYDVYDLNNTVDFPLENLKALFPMLDVEMWKSWLNRVILSTFADEDLGNEDIGTIYPVIPNNGQTRLVSKQILDILLKHYERVENEMAISTYTEWVDREKFAVSYDDIFCLLSDVPDYIISQALDFLIDQSLIIPTELKFKSEGKIYWIRGIRLDGEYTYHLTRMVRRSLA